MNPVISDLAEFITNSIAGNFVAQSFWFGEMQEQSIWVMVQFACLVIPSV